MRERERHPLYATYTQIYRAEVKIAAIKPKIPAGAMPNVHLNGLL
jgi:hypothetical protein